MEPITNLIIEHFWPISITILGLSFAGYVAYRNNRFNRTVEAAKIFRSAINIETFKGVKGHQLHNLLIMKPTVIGGAKFEGEFLKHRRAVQEFRINLGLFDRLRLNHVWRKYHGGDENCPDLFKLYCLPGNGPDLLKHRLLSLREIGEKK